MKDETELDLELEKQFFHNHIKNYSLRIKHFEEEGAIEEHFVKLIKEVERLRDAITGFEETVIRDSNRILSLENENSKLKEEIEKWEDHECTDSSRNWS